MMCAITYYQAILTHSLNWHGDGYLMAPLAVLEKFTYCITFCLKDISDLMALSFLYHTINCHNILSTFMSHLSGNPHCKCLSSKFTTLASTTFL